jgi:two-component system nitrogen regulation response regulator NtrX
VEVNCAAIPEDLIESELFGHERGAFTGAERRRAGAFERADGGTLFLDEIGDMSLKTQAKILRALQERQFNRVGGTEVLTSDVRVVAATNKDLRTEIEKGQFREDLFYRLNVVPIEVPPLRDRAGDIPLLVGHFMAEFCHANRRPMLEIAEDAMRALTGYSWPGNVRELKNVVERMAILCRGTQISREDVPVELRGGPEGPVPGRRRSDSLESLLRVSDLRQARAAFEREFLRRKLEEHEGNVSRTAEAVGVERTNLHRKLKSYGLKG